MVTKIEGYKAHDGKIFLSEEAAVRHESLERLCQLIPEFQMIRPRLAEHLDAVATAMGPMLDFRRRVPSPGPVVDPSAEEPDCTCGVSMDTPRNHHRTCPVYRALFPTGRQIYEASKKPKLDVCRPVAGVSRA